MRRQVGHLPARVIPEPAEMIDAAFRIIRTRWRGSQPHLIVHLARRITIRTRSEAGHDVTKRTRSRAVNLADVSRPQQIASLLIVQPASLLRTALHHTLMPP